MESLVKIEMLMKWNIFLNDYLPNSLRYRSCMIKIFIKYFFNKACFTLFSNIYLFYSVDDITRVFCVGNSLWLRHYYDIATCRFGLTELIKSNLSSGHKRNILSKNNCDLNFFCPWIPILFLLIIKNKMFFFF